MTDARWRIFQDASALAEAAAEAIVAAIEVGGAAPAICLTGGSTPRGVYGLLGRDPWASRIAWRRVHWFVGDERFVPPGDERSNLGEARRLFLDRCAPKENIHAVRTDAADVHAAAQLYEDELRNFCAERRARALFDLVLLGVGPDGHVASLFAACPVTCEQGSWAAGVEQPGLAPFVPRVTLTFDALSSCRNLLFMAQGAAKAPVLSRIAQGDDLPATRVTAQRGALWLVDKAAAPPVALLGPRIILVMGVSGSGKTTIGGALAARIGWSFLDADDLHSDANKAKMRSGAPLTDEDRAPWLSSIRDELARRRSEGADIVVACSALKRRYRDVILPAFARSQIVRLRGDASLFALRLEKRLGHFMPPSLLGDQLNVLEDPVEDEYAFVVDADGPVQTQISFIAARLQRFIEAGRL
jgi:gluconokinase/6-phosphogluconolactonase